MDGRRRLQAVRGPRPILPAVAQSVAVHDQGGIGTLRRRQLCGQGPLPLRVMQTVVQSARAALQVPVPAGCQLTASDKQREQRKDNNKSRGETLLGPPVLRAST